MRQFNFQPSQILRQELEEKRVLWVQKLHLLEKYKESLDKDFIRMAGNLRRSKTEQLHLRKDLSARQREVEAVKQLQEEAAGQAEALGLDLEKATRQLEDANREAKEQVEAFRSACEEAASLRFRLEEAISEQQKLQDMNAALRSTCHLLQEKMEEQKTTLNELRREVLKGRLSGLHRQSTVDEEPDYSLLPPSTEPARGKLCYSKKQWIEGPSLCTDRFRTLPLDIACWSLTPLLDALTLEIPCPHNASVPVWHPCCKWSSGSCMSETCSLDVTPAERRWKICSAGNRADADLPVSITTMESSLAEEKSPWAFYHTMVVDAFDAIKPFSTDHSASRAEVVLAASSGSITAVTDSLVMEDKPPECSRAKEEVPTSVAAEKNGGTDLSKKEFCPVTEERKTSQNALKQDLEVDREKETKKEQSEDAPPMVPSRKGSSPNASGIKGDKTKQNDLDSPNEKEVEAEFLRLSLGFKCDLFTLDKRVRLEERSRDLAEENLKKEITNASKLLEALVPLCEDDNQAQEIIKKLQKSLQFLGQYAARVASRAEMLGAINQESRVSKAVEVMIQHVENLKRMYTKEHAELEELKQVLLQNERSFSSLADQDESTNKKLPNSLNFKPPSSLRRANLTTLPRSAGNAGAASPLAQPNEMDGDERSDRFNRRSSSWGRLGAKQNEKRPSLQRFISTYSWTEYEDERSETNNEESEAAPEAEEEKARKESISEKKKCPSKWSLESACNLMSSWASHLKTSFGNANKTLWVSVSILVLLAALTSFLTGLSLQRPADAAPVGTGDSWTSLQQLLWPYTGLQHNGPPPV
ncbi:inositol 1,4,5-triphosphate receptor associated 2 [Eudromia elegans]